jgi:50S ribosomal protein L16 3-hydroxylase
LKRVSALNWQESDVCAFLGEYLSEPKPHVFFDAPERVMKSETFFQRAMARGLRLDHKSQLVYEGKSVFINGEAIKIQEAAARKRIFRFADERTINAEDFVTLAHYSSVVRQLYEWYLAGWIHVA